MQFLKPLFYALLTFAAACSVSIGPGGALLVGLPPLDGIIAHADLYGAGLLVVIELFGRLVPASADSSLLALLTRLADSLVTNRATGGGHFTSLTVRSGGLAV